jgi:hypothetical protein
MKSAPSNGCVTLISSTDEIKHLFLFLYQQPTKLIQPTANGKEQHNLHHKSLRNSEIFIYCVSEYYPSSC